MGDSFKLPTTAILAVCHLACISVCVVGLQGCTRTKYRKAADAEAYSLIHSRQSDPRWVLPNRGVEPQRTSRMYLASERDCGPKPPDDVAAHRYMSRPDQKKIHYYDKIPTRTRVENPAWLELLPRTEDGEIELTQPLAIDLGLLNSREYQTEFERVYLSALNLSGDRFEFDTQWFGGFRTDYTATGKDLGGIRLLELSDRFGFTRSLAGGGQFATEVLNGLSWDFGNGGVQSGSAAIISTFTQPLLRGAFRHVRLESLTQAERNLLYEVRDFARFRRQFYVDVTERYLGLLTQLQAIRNTETNAENLKQNLVEHEFYAILKIVSQVQVDQVFQDYQDARRTLLQSEQLLITSADQYKFLLGLPSWVSFKIDESLLEPFELADPRLVELQGEAQELFEALVQYLPPARAPLESLQEMYARYRELRERVAELVPSVESDLESWKQRLKETDDTGFSEDDRLDFDQQVQLTERIALGLSDLKKGLEGRQSYNEDLVQKLTDYEQNPPQETEEEEQRALDEILKNVESFEDVKIEDLLPDDKDNTAVAAWKALEDAIGSRLREEIADLYVAQTQIKLFLIEIEPEAIESDTAITYALQNRLDLMNSKALVVDAYRRVEVAADALQSDLDVSAGVVVGSDANSKSPFKLDSANNRYTLGVRFDGPLNRLNERNVYRAAQIAYQRASRDYIQFKDQIANEVRLILRRMELSRVSFQIARQQVIAATRQVEQAQIDLRRSSQAESNLTINLLLALEGLLNAKNRLIANWVDYRVQKLRLFVALELLYLDENGLWLNEDTGLEMLKGYQAIDPEYFPPQWYNPDEIQGGDYLPPAPMAIDPELIESAIESDLIDAGNEPDLPAPDANDPVLPAPELNGQGADPQLVDPN